MSAHAILSASKAERWLHCPPSIRMSEGEPDTGSAYAAAGTLAHAIAETKARAYFLEPCTKRQLTGRLKPLREDPSYDKEMDSATDAYLDYLKELAMRIPSPSVALETRVDYGEYAPEGFGTADCIMIGGTTLAVVDYKNGAGVPVEAEGNPQMMLYALGALKLYRPIFGDAITDIHLAIVQPHAGGVKEWQTTVADLEDWGKHEVAPAAQLAWQGKGDITPGAWCRFCPVKAKCPARARVLLELEPVKVSTPDPRLLNDMQVGGLLARGRALIEWVKDLEEYVFGKVLAGEKVDGWKLVAGRSSRDWAGGVDAAFEQLQARGVQEAMLYERKPVSVAGLEKIVGKKGFAEYADLVEKKPGKPTLVPADDPRPDYDPAVAAFGAVS